MSTDVPKDRSPAGPFAEDDDTGAVSATDDWDITGSWAPLPGTTPGSAPVGVRPDVDDAVARSSRPSPPPPVQQARAAAPTEDRAVDMDPRSSGSEFDDVEGESTSGPNRNGPRSRRRDRRAGDRWVEEDFPPPRRGRAFLGFLLTLALIAGGVLYGVTWYQRQVDPPGVPGPEVSVVIPSNTSTSGIAKLLHTNKVVSNAKVFRYWTQVQGKGGFEAGKYVFRQNSSFAATLDVLQNGPSVPEQQKVTIPEGFRVEQIAARIAEKLPGRSGDKFLAAVKANKIRSAYQPVEVTNLEGFLFPDTYVVGLEENEELIATRMVENFDQVGDSLGLGSSQDKVELTPYETLIVASLIEREAKLDSDRAKISRVIYNRLKANMYLQIDATILYAMNDNTTRLLLEDLKLDTPYNSYTNKGLPPGPIANPGRASLEAALNPEPGDWLYYVVTSADGAHSFATSFKEHRRNIALAKERGVR